MKTFQILLGNPKETAMSPKRKPRRRKARSAQFPQRVVIFKPFSRRTKRREEERCLPTKNRRKQGNLGQPKQKYISSTPYNVYI
jgi:hypothetical protein